MEYNSEHIRCEINRMAPSDRPAHDWFRLIDSFPPPITRDYLLRFEQTPGARLLDPFCRDGALLVEARKLGWQAWGVESDPFNRFASQARLNWAAEPASLVAHAEAAARAALTEFAAQGLSDDPTPLFYRRPQNASALRRLPPAAEKLPLARSMGDLPLHKTLTLLEAIRQNAAPAETGLMELALANLVIYEIGNLRYEPQPCVAFEKNDARLVLPWLEAVRQMARDLPVLQAAAAAPACVAARFADLPAEGLIDGVISVLPRRGEDLTRTTRLPGAILGLLRSRWQLTRLRRAQSQPGLLPLTFQAVCRRLKPGALLVLVTRDYLDEAGQMVDAASEAAGQLAPLGCRLEGVDSFRTRLEPRTRASLREQILRLRFDPAAAV